MKNFRCVEPEQQDEIREQCINLWKNNFDDSEEYTAYYFEHRWRKASTFISDGVSMINLNPYDLNFCGNKVGVHYIVGVCTDSSYRRLGYMDMLIRESLRYLKDKGEPFTYLMPASEKIYIPYDFTGIYPVKSAELDTRELRTGLCDNYVCREYMSLSDKDKKIFVEFVNKKLEECTDCYVIRDRQYFEGIYYSAAAERGNVLTFWDKDRCMGYFYYFWGEQTEIPECIAEEEAFEAIISAFTDKTECNGVLSFYETSFIDNKLLNYKDSHNYLMARIISLEKFIPMIKRMHDEIWVEISDDIISSNSGKWHIIFDENGSSIEKCDESGKIFTKYNIAEFGKMCFDCMKFSLNELV